MQLLSFCCELWAKLTEELLRVVVKGTEFLGSTSQAHHTDQTWQHRVRVRQTKRERNIGEQQPKE